MTTVENALLQQMQKLAATMTAMQGASSKDTSGQAAVSFQDMLQKSGSKTASETNSKEPQDKPLTDGGEAVTDDKRPGLPEKDEEELKPELLAANPNAMAALELFRPEIVDTAEPVEPVLDPIPQETVEGAALDLGQQGAEVETTVDSEVGAEVSMEQQPKDFQQAMKEPAAQQNTETVESAPQQEAPRQEAAPQQVPETVEKPEVEAEVKAEVRVERDEEPANEEAPAAEQPVFHETESVPVKVGERYETVDTQKPEMENNLADTIRTAVQSGQERIEIRLSPENLGTLTIEMTRDTAGVLQVVLHASTPKAEGLLNQHLNGLHTALQGYGNEEVHVEVQRGQESQEQHFRQADPDGKGQHQHRQQQERQEEQSSGEEFLQKLRLGLFGMDE